MLVRILRRSVNLIPWKVRLAIKRIPLVAPIQRLLVERFLSHGSFEHVVNAGPALGLRYPVALPLDKGVWTGTYEADFSFALVAAVRHGDICFDIGGYRGFYAGVLALKGAKRVYCFEPFDDNCRQIRRVISLNPSLPIELLQIAVGGSSGSTEFEVMPEASMGKLSTSAFQEGTRGSARVVVEVASLDDLLAQGKVEPANVVKIDVEGAEVDVLKGGRRMLASSRPRLFIEIHSRDLARQCYAILAEAGYAIQVLETGVEPDYETEPEVCHFMCSAI